MKTNSAEEIPPCPENQCRQCWEHSFLHQRENFWLANALGIAVKRDKCRPCLDHMRTKCGTVEPDERLDDLDMAEW